MSASGALIGSTLPVNLLLAISEGMKEDAAVHDFAFDA
jgi:hypothetical protein